MGHGKELSNNFPVKRKWYGDVWRGGDDIKPHIVPKPTKVKKYILNRQEIRQCIISEIRNKFMFEDVKKKPWIMQIVSQTDMLKTCKV